ncbi:nucleolar protein 12-like [Argentina anserina]|uniref:nucleolar protein 12-like n=1 Tax=Argentina anserina TaxID=57926 RepID=UPI00217681D7|nr:nucleolar protein 12-like [Potentilla anserina]
MSLVQSEFSIDPKPKRIRTHEKLKAVEAYLSQLEVKDECECEYEDEEEDDDDDYGIDDDEEGEEEEEVQAEDQAKEEFVLCGVCLKDKEHWTFDCTYLVRIPNPMEVTLGPGYE